MVHPSQQKPHYPGRKPLPTIIFARNGKVRSFKVRLWVAVPLLCLIGLCVTAYIGASAYLIYRDDLLGATLARQVEMQYSYEDRIAALRAELDRVTSRHLVQTASVEDQIGILLERQATIEERQATLVGLVEHARASGIEIATVGIADAAIRMPRARPDNAVASAASVVAAAPPAAPLAFAEDAEADDIITGALLRQAAPIEDSDSEMRMRPMLMDVQSSLDDLQPDRTRRCEALSVAAEAEADRISAAVEPLGVKLEDASEEEPQGGPYIPASGLHFVEQAALLRRSLDEVAGLRRAAEALPLRPPVSSHTYLEPLRLPHGSIPEARRAPCRARLRRADRQRGTRDRAGHRRFGGLERRLRAADRDPPRQRHQHPLRAPFGDPSDRGPAGYGRRARSGASARRGARPARTSTTRRGATAKPSIRRRSSRPGRRSRVCQQSTRHLRRTPCRRRR